MRSKGADPVLPLGRSDVVGRSTYLSLLTVVAVLVLVGLVMVLSASSVQSLQDFGSTWSYFSRQATWVTFGTIALVVTLRIDYRTSAERGDDFARAVAEVAAGHA